MRNSFWDRRIPTIFALLFILAGIGVSAWLVQSGVIFNTQAAPGNEPENIKLTNITSVSFAVTFTTDDTVPASVAFGETKEFGSIALDDRDDGTDAAPKRTHHITVKNLSPEKTYYFSIISGGEIFLRDGEPFSITLPKPLEGETAVEKTITGTVQTTDGEKPHEVYVTFFIDGSQVLSTTVSSDGTFSLPLPTVRNEALDQEIPITNETSGNIFATDGQGSIEVTFLLDGSPLPTLSLGNTYDFSLSPDTLPSDASAAAGLNFPPVEEEKKTKKQPEISTPTQDEKFTDQQPEFQGKALPNEPVTIVIHSDDNLTAKVFADKSGKWTFRPEAPLSPGSHTITITTRDSNGFLKTITQSFTVFAEGSQFVEPSVSPRASITPSRSLTRTPTPTPTKTATKTASPTPEKQVPTLTATPTIEPTKTPVITVVPSTPITPVPTIPEVGSSSLILTGIGAVVFVIIGLSIFLLTRSSIPL